MYVLPVLLQPQSHSPGRTILTMKIGFRIDNGGTILATLPANTTSHTVSGLAPGTYMCFDVRLITAMAIRHGRIGLVPLLWQHRVPIWGSKAQLMSPAKECHWSRAPTTGRDGEKIFWIGERSWCVGQLLRCGPGRQSPVNRHHFPPLDLGPGVSRSVSVNWWLSQNVERHQLLAEVGVPSSVVDPNGTNNAVRRYPISVFYADFRHSQNGYLFESRKAQISQLGMY